MLSGNLPSPNSPYNTKSSLQALLKSRRELLHIRENFPEKSNEKQLMRNLLNVAEKNIVNFKSYKTTNEDISPTTDQNGDFTYSQKLFHIADGNLYSIFSPLQGRSYGMKPSFLRKQKCTIQECRGRGRKVLRKGLKFHNFLPSESVTSEKGSSTSIDEQWKVHSECKLKEEHGTKQIMVSNWSHNIKHSSNNNVQESASSEEMLTSSDINSESVENTPLAAHENKILSGTVSRTCDFDVSDSLPKSDQEVKYSDPLIVKTPPKLLKSEKHNFLNNLLLTVSNSHISHSSSLGTNFHKQIVCEGQKHRRKPEQTRRIVPYTKYLSIMEETEIGPLDLSLHSNNNIQTSSGTFSSENLIKSNRFYGKSDEVLCSLPSVDNKLSESTTSNNSYAHRKVKNSHNTDGNSVQFKSVVQPCYSNASSFTFPVYENPLSMCSSTSTNESNANSSKQNYFVSNTQCSSSLECRNAPILSNAVSSHQNSRAKYCETSKLDLNTKPRKRSQRSVIKQKLEDTFKQNGFLVKTKQVSDGEATFCKFRQLRKYTRYYLKSWQQHLPDEVHKMWKGFLPPKTVLPPILPSSSETT